MYPNLYYLIKDLFGIELNALKLVNSFGFFVAMSFVASGYVLYMELKRKSALGEFTYTEEKEIIGAPATTGELLSAGFFGFIFGYKLIGAFIIADALSNTQAFILSLDGSMGAGILVAAIMVYLKWKEKDKVKLTKPETRTVQVWPQDRVGDIVLKAALWGFLGAKIFHNLENLEEFSRDPIGSLISFSGLTFFGGLILGAASDNTGIGFYIAIVGLGFMALATAFSFITLPVEYDASNRALAWLKNKNMVNQEEFAGSRDALKWAARTYLVAALGSLAMLLYWGLQVLGSRD